MKEIVIDEKNSNQRLDKLLKKVLSEATGGFIYKMLRKKNITLNDKKATGTEILNNGDSIKIYFSDETYEKLSGVKENDSFYEQLKQLPCDIYIIHEDEDKIIINKPSGILSQKASDTDVSINEMALSYLINKKNYTKEQLNSFHPSVVNRLDRNTSGIIIFAKNLKAAQELSESLKIRSSKKIYHAVVKGKVLEKQRIEGYLLKDDATNTVTISKEELADSKEIATEYEPIGYPAEDLTLLSIHLITGRTHQIRAHLSSIGHPILGDYKYGDPVLNKKYKVKDQLLHARLIEFNSKEKYTADYPEDFYGYI